MDRYAVADTTDDPVHRTPALTACRIDVVEHLPGVHRRDCPVVIPLGSRRLVTGIAGDVGNGREEIWVWPDAEAEPSHGASKLGGDNDCAVVVVLISAVGPSVDGSEVAAGHRAVG